MDLLEVAIAVENFRAFQIIIQTHFPLLEQVCRCSWSLAINQARYDALNESWRPVCYPWPDYPLALSVRLIRTRSSYRWKVSQSAVKTLACRSGETDNHVEQRRESAPCAKCTWKHSRKGQVPGFNGACADCSTLLWNDAQDPFLLLGVRNRPRNVHHYAQGTGPYSHPCVHVLCTGGEYLWGFCCLSVCLFVCLFVLGGPQQAL